MQIYTLFVLDSGSSCKEMLWNLKFVSLKVKEAGNFESTAVIRNSLVLDFVI